MAKMRTTSGGTLDVLMKDLLGKAVRTRRELRNGNMTIPKGTVCEVDGTWRSGVYLRAGACPHCGVEVAISRVHRDDVLLVVDGDGLPMVYRRMLASPRDVQVFKEKITREGILMARELLGGEQE